MGRKSLKNTRQKEIIKAFYKVSVKEGLENASIAKVAKEMGINPSLIIHYFSSKEDLIFGLISYILDRYKSIYTSEDTIKDTKLRLINIINNLFSREWNSYIDDGVFYSCFTHIFRSQKIKLAFKEVHDYLRSLLTEVITDAKKENIVAVENAAEAANLIFIMVEGAYYYLSFFEDNKEYKEKLAAYRKAAFEILKLENPIS